MCIFWESHTGFLRRDSFVCSQTANHFNILLGSYDVSLVVSGEFIAGDLVKFYFLREYPDIYQESMLYFLIRAGVLYKNLLVFVTN